MENFKRCCSNCEYFYRHYGGSVCNALRTLPGNKNQAFNCVDFEPKDIEKQLQRNTELQTRVRQEKSKVFELVDLLDRYSDRVSEMIQQIFMDSRFYREEPSLCENQLTIEEIFDIIDRQVDQIQHLSNIKPCYVLLSVNVRIVINRHFYENLSYFRGDTENAEHPLRSRFGLHPLTDASLPHNFIQVIVPIHD